MSSLNQRTLPSAARFDLSLTKAMSDQLGAAFEKQVPERLDEGRLSLVKPRKGVYGLWVDKTLVYVGKAEKLNDRLHQHLRKLSGRKGINLADMKFQCLYVEEDLSTFAPEKMLIDIHKKSGAVAWNNNGFGSKDPGRERDTSKVKEGHFDRKHPIDLDRPLPPLDFGSSTGGIFDSETVTLAKALSVVKSGLPFLFRYEKSQTKFLQAPELVSPPVGEPWAARSLLTWIANGLPAGYLTVALPAYVISYSNDSEEKYPSRTGAWLSLGNGRCEYRPHVPEFSTKPVTAADLK